MPEHEMPGYCGTNGAKWTDAFLQIHPGGSSDWGTMAGWFANAIEQGREAGRREGDKYKRQRDMLLDALEPLMVANDIPARELAGQLLEARRKVRRAIDAAKGPTPEAGYWSLLRETVGGRLGASKGDEGGE